ncbi:MAG TPA: HEAT repeat domain-containing protein [Candidatus Acidoferrales bacterium]|nr:HEAT repeat domain-containing protein [Candidatus Acidoferrales bacterium]
MTSGFKWLVFGPAALVVKAILFSLGGILLLVAFILARRTIRRRYFDKVNALTFFFQQHWNGIVEQKLPIAFRKQDKLEREVLEGMVVDRLERASPEEIERLVAFLRTTGLLDARIVEARKLRGWRRRKALVALGRTRAPEAIGVLAESLESRDFETRTAAVRGLGRAALPEAGEAILRCLSERGLEVPAPALQNALLSCCRARPGLLLTFQRRTSGEACELLARVLGEIATPELGDDLLLLAEDSRPELRASAARALDRSKVPGAFEALEKLARDPEWFVRLRAVTALASFSNPRALQILLNSLCDINRYVRLRAASGLVKQQPEILEILHQVVATRDSYALQAMISELERSGAFTRVLEILRRPGGRDEAAAVLENALEAGLAELHHAVKPAASSMTTQEKRASGVTVEIWKKKDEGAQSEERRESRGEERGALMGARGR